MRRSSTPEGAFPLDLHVLGTPPAFVLSQDQTLRFELGTKADTSKCACLVVRNDAPRSPEKGSKYQLNYVNPSLSGRALGLAADRTSFGFQRPLEVWESLFRALQTRVPIGGRALLRSGSPPGTGTGAHLRKHRGERQDHPRGERARKRGLSATRRKREPPGAYRRGSRSSPR